MTDRTITIEHDGTKYTGHIGTIDSTSLGFEDHGILTAWLMFSWPGGGVGIGGFCLDEPADRKGRDYSRKGTAYGLDHIIRIIETVGVDKWEQVKGSKAIVLFDYTPHGSTLGSRSRGIAGLLGDKVLILDDHASLWKERLSADAAARAELAEKFANHEQVRAAAIDELADMLDDPAPSGAGAS